MELKRNRTIFSEKGNTLNEEEIKARDAKSLEEHKNSQDELSAIFNQEEIEFLKSVNFDLIKRILDDVAQRSGVDPKTLNFLPLERVIPNTKTTELASYSSETNMIHFSLHEKPYLFPQSKNYAENLKRIREDIIKTYGSLKIFGVHTIIHEQIHAVSKIVLKTPSSKNENQVGYGEGKQDDISSISVLVSLNEGVTEKLAAQVLTEYLERSVSDQEEFKEYQKYQLTAYPDEIKLVNLLISKIAENTLQSERVVWEAMIRGLLEGNELNEIEIKNLFTEIFGEKFLSNLRKASPKGQQNYGPNLNKHQISLQTNQILYELEDSHLNDSFRKLNPNYFKPEFLDKLAEFFNRLIDKLKK